MAESLMTYVNWDSSTLFQSFNVISKLLLDQDFFTDNLALKCKGKVIYTP